jgi:hypothetical protein
LRAFTPKEQKAIKVIAQTFRNESTLDVTSTIGRLKIGEALVSFLDETGSPVPVRKAFVCPPRSRIGSTEINSSAVATSISIDELSII